METIKINSITKKGEGLVIVNYNDNKEATLNTKWQTQEVDYLEKDVGIGGTVSVLIMQKGQYTNITKIDMTSATKGSPIQPTHPQAELMTNKDIMIISQCLTKAWASTHSVVCQPQEVLEAYNFFVKSLENGE